MEISGRWGFSWYWSRRSDSGIRAGQTPGKYWSKNLGRFALGFSEMEAKCEAEAKRVHVKEASEEGMAMNIKEPAGQM